MPKPQLARLARAASISTTASWPKSPPEPPYSSGMEVPSRPSSPASFQVSRSIMPCSRHLSKRGAQLSRMKAWVISSSIRCSSVIQSERRDGIGHQNASAGSAITGSAPERMRARCRPVAGSWRAM